jgi:HD superfamily phosphodiesterase
MKTTKDVGHDFGHAQRVARDVRLIGEKLGYEDVDLLEVCAWWHDVGRLYHPDHEKLSAKLMIYDLKKRGVDYWTRREAYKAVYKHRWDMEPKTMQGQIIKDADKLDFISVERWNQRVAAHDMKSNHRNLSRLPYVRKHFYFDISRQLFDKRIGKFAENLEHAGARSVNPRLVARHA